MKRTKIKKLVLTDGTWYFANSAVDVSFFTDDPRKAWNFHCETSPTLNEKRRLHWELDKWTKHEPYAKSTKNRWLNGSKIDRSNFKLKWITIIETIKEETFNYEGFADTDRAMCGEKYDDLK